MINIQIIMNIQISLDIERIVHPNDYHKRPAMKWSKTKKTEPLTSTEPFDEATKSVGGKGDKGALCVLASIHSVLVSHRIAHEDGKQHEGIYVYRSPIHSMVPGEEDWTSRCRRVC